ncbi:hypothetical protein V7J91_26815, partial [Klebsiella pneumoniae]
GLGRHIGSCGPLNRNFLSLLIFLPAFDVPTQQLGEQSYNLLFNLIAGEKGLQNITIGTQILLTDFLI